MGDIVAFLETRWAEVTPIEDMPARITTTPAVLSDEEYQDLKRRWQEEYRAHRTRVVEETPPVYWLAADDIASKRAILAMWQDPSEVETLPDGAVDARDWDERERDVAVAEAIDEAVRWLAWPYRSHPDWRQEWAPEGVTP